MAFFGSILRARRGDFHLLLVAALIALLVLPGASHAAIAPQSAEAVLLWLHNESVAAPSAAPLVKASDFLAAPHQIAASAPQDSAGIQFSAATFHCGQHLHPPAPPTANSAHSAPATPSLERHAVAHLSGVRTNRRLN